MRYITTHDAPPTELRGIGDRTWQHRGACNSLSPKVADRRFFPTTRNFTSIAEAKQTCARCPVQETCLRAAIDSNTTDGIWGGRTPAERAHLHKGLSERLEQDRVYAVLAGRDVPLSTRERQAVAREAVVRGWSARRLAYVLGFTVRHSRDLMSMARHELRRASDGEAFPDLPADAGTPHVDNAEDRTGAEEFDALEGPTDEELAEQDDLLGQEAA